MPAGQTTAPLEVARRPSSRAAQSVGIYRLPETNEIRKMLDHAARPSPSSTPSASPAAPTSGLGVTRKRKLVTAMTNPWPAGYHEAVQYGDPAQARFRADLLHAGRQTQLAAYQPSTQSSWRTGLHWWSKFCQEAGLKEEVIDINVASVSDRMLASNLSVMLFEYVADRRHGQGPAGSMLPSTSTRYLHPVIKLLADMGVDLWGLGSNCAKPDLHARCSKRCLRRTGPT